MIFKSKANDIYFISRINNTIYENLHDGTTIPIYKLKQSFPDVLIMSKYVIDYMDRYIEMFPHLVEKVETSQKDQQLSLF